MTFSVASEELLAFFWIQPDGKSEATSDPRWRTRASLD